MDDEAKVLIRAGDVEIDISGAQNSVDERLIRVKEDDTWSIALSRIRNARASNRSSSRCCKRCWTSERVQPSVRLLRIAV